MSLTHVTTETLEELCAASKKAPILLLKHSNACGTSERILEKTKSVLQTREDMPVYVLTVQERRDLSDEIEQQYGIQHESPQAIVLYDCDPLYYDDHASIDFDTIVQIIREADLLV